MNTTSAVPPALINGRGTPVGGILPLTTAILIKTWLAIIVVIPVAKKQPNLSLLFIAILIPLNINSPKIEINIIQPNNPNSSPIIEKIKSDSANGKNRYFCLLLNSPTPNNPPLAKL